MIDSFAMPDLIQGWHASLAWPVAMALAWLTGEFGRRWLGLPRISGYGIAGFALGSGQLGWLPGPDTGLPPLLANLAFALILFELGYRINLNWLRANPWLGVTSLAESTGTFVAVFLTAQWFGVAMVPALVLAALSMSTSPAAVVRVCNEMHGAGQVTERALHLTAFNCVLAVIAFKVVLGYWVIANAGDVFQALWSSIVVVLVSIGLGALFGIATPGLLRRSEGRGLRATVVFALAVLLLTALTHAFKFSPLLAALAFGLVARHRRVVLSQAERDFGALGDVLAILLFVFVAATLDWRQVVDGFPLALAIIAARSTIKALATTLLAQVGGITWRKGLLTGMALTPLSVFAILLLEQTRHLGVDLGVQFADRLPGIAAIVLTLEVLGPLATKWALVWAGETHPARRY